MMDKSLYSIWRGMKNRCLCKSNGAYKDYGGRGISVCERWQTSYQNFFDDMNPRPSPKHTLDRIDNDGNYETNNVRWATYAEQAKNRRKQVRNRQPRGKEQRLVILVDSKLKRQFENYLSYYGRSQKWTIHYLITGLVTGKIKVETIIGENK